MSWLRQRAGRIVLLAAVAGFLVVALPAVATADPGDFGVQGPSFSGANAPVPPSGPKPESKLWFADGLWWGYLFDSASGDFHLFKFNAGSQTWTDTGVVGDTRNNTTADVLWDGAKLYVASHIQTDSGAGTGYPSYLYRYSYDAGSDSYTPDAGFPAQINNYRSESLVIGKDSTGQLWVTWMAGSKVWLNSTVCSPACSDSSWGTPFTLAVPNASSDDISSIIAFGGNKTGVFWSNQSTNADYFAVHNDADGDSTWSVETATSGPGIADDHVNLKTDSSGRVFAATKTSTDPLQRLLVRTPGGTWVPHVFGTDAESHTRPIVLLDLANGLIRMYATVGQSGGTIYEKDMALSDADTSGVDFPTGLGTPVIRDASHMKMNNATSTKQNVDASTGLLVLATNKITGSDRYWFTYSTLAPDTTPPVLQSATVNGTTMTLTYSEALNTTAPAPSVYTPGAGSVAWTATNATISGSTVTVTISPAVTNGQTVAVDYTVPGANPVRDLAGNPAVALNDQAVTNNTPPPGGSGPIALAGTAISASILTGSTVTLPSWTPAANDLILVSVAQRDESKAMSVSGNGLTWTQIANVDNAQGQGGIALWRAQGPAPTSGPISVTITGNLKPVIVEAQRFRGVDTGTPVEAQAANAGPAVDNRNMLQAVTTATPGAWAVAAGWNRSTAFIVPSGETEILINQAAGSSGDATRSSMWYQGPVASPASTQLGAANDLAAVNDWAMIVVALRPGGGGGLDVTPPALSSAQVNGSSLTLTYNEALDAASVPAAGAFNPKVGGVPRGVTNVGIAGSIVTLTLASPVISTDTVTVDYTPGGSPIQDAAGNDAAALTNQAVTNNTPAADTTPPVLSSAAVNGSSLTLTYNETLDAASVPAAGAFNPKVGGVPRGVTNVGIAGAIVTLTLASPVVSTNTVTVDYTPGANPIQDIAGNDAAALTNQAVTNNTPGGGGGTIALAGSAITASIATGTTVTLPSWTPGANDLILVSVAQRDESKAIQVSGNSLTWTQIANVDNVQGQGGIALWRAQGSSPTAGAITVTVTGNTLPVVVTARRFSGVSTATPVEAQAVNAGPAVDDRNMLQAVTTATPGAWAVAVGWHRTALLAIPGGETAITINQAAGTGGDITRSSMWYEGPVTAPASTQLGAANDLSTANDWSMVVVALKPGP